MSEQSLFSLSAFCKSLTSLEISLSASQTARHQNVQPGGVFSSLTFLTLRPLYTELPRDVPHIPAFLGKLCPQVSELVVRRLHVMGRPVDSWPLVEGFNRARRVPGYRRKFCLLLMAEEMLRCSLLW